MKALLQRVHNASVSVDGKTVGSCQRGWFILLGVSQEDTVDDCSYLVNKIIKLRGFGDKDDKMNLDVKAIDGGILVVSQFTLYADLSRGNRPGFTSAAKPEHAKTLYEVFVDQLKSESVSVETGIFGAKMDIQTLCDGPVTFLIETFHSKKETDYELP